MKYDCIIIGGGIAGLQGAIQLGRYKYKVLVIDSNEGRSTICRSYHNVLGYPDGVSGPELRSLGREQAESLGVEFVEDSAKEASKTADGFVIETKNGKSYEGRRLLFATGVMDRIPPWPALSPCLGISVYVCPDCDGYEISDKRTIVLGSGNPGANMARILHYWSKDIVYINHERTEVDAAVLQRLKEKGITYINQPVGKILADGPEFRGVELEGGEKVEAERGFVAFGGNEVKSQLAAQLGVDLHHNKHILVDPRTKMTNVEHVWAAGDIVAHSEQVTIAMGDGSQAGIWIHKTLVEE
ncbi:NAD(P)/FAD-dependent oxidoreductase [Mesobacillus zeae]|uniref:NAD(P)/FAD-dependent oxidoreductase n=1 Tax=Mesobacillus zeae TaxID=1917180 RepID=A0A398BAG0_9BACI|nr:NAD(P)/FAD-dependent oxidoreductase [Mesobacillus zeae]RID86807.1 NAD(P)/FAD-dependent oxidoreductase [Mesobacillus zeae]